MRGARGLTVALAALLLAALGTAHTASDGKQVTPVPKRAAGAGGGDKWAVIVGVSDYDDPAIPDLGYSASDARTVYGILTDPKRGGYRPSNVRLLVSGASDPGSRPTRRNIMGRVEVFLSQAGPGDTVLFYFSGHGIEHQEQGYLLPSDAESGPLLPQFAVSLEFLNRSLAANGATQRIVLLDACYSGVGKAIGEGMGAAFAQSLFASADGRVTLASCGPAEQSYEWPDRSASVFTHYVCDGLSGKADYDQDQSVSLTELHRYVSEQVRRWAADHNKQQSPRMQADVSGEIVIARVPIGGERAGPQGAAGPAPQVTEAQVRDLERRVEAAALLRAQAAAERGNAADSLARLEKLFAQGAVSSTELDDHRRRLGEAEATLAARDSEWNTAQRDLAAAREALASSRAQAAAPQPIRTTATLRVSSDPSGAQVMVDGAPRGTTPCDVDVDLGAAQSKQVEAVVQRKGYKSQGARITLVRGQTAQWAEVRLEPVKPEPPPAGPAARRRPAAGVDLASLTWPKEPVRTLESDDRSPVGPLAFSPDGQMLASGCSDKTVKLWDTATGQLLYTLVGHGGIIFSVSFSRDGQLVASGSGDGTVRLWQVVNGSSLLTLAGHRGKVTSVAFSPDGSVLASGSWDGTVRVWEWQTGRLLRTLSGRKGKVTCLAFDAKGRVLAAGSWDRAVDLWEVQSGRLLRAVGAPSGYVDQVILSPDGRLLATASRMEDKTCLWDTGSGRLLRAVPGESASFSPDGTVLASGIASVYGPSMESPIRLWEASTGRLLHTLAVSQDAPTDVAFSPDGRLLAAGLGHGTIRLWQMPEELWVR
jgi:WD40 repeat protein